MEVTEREVLQEAIKDILAGSKSTVWIGAGLSVSGHYPTWEKLIADLCQLCGVNTSAPENRDLGFQRIANLCFAADPVRYKEHLAKEFGRTITATNKSYERLISLKFHAYITTNFDPLLADAATKDTTCEVFDYPELVISKLGVPGSVNYIHGLARKNNTPCVDDLVLSETEFRAAYKSGLLQGLLTEIFTYHSILFLGYRLGEPQVFRILKDVAGIQKRILARNPNSVAPKRILIVNEPEDKEGSDEHSKRQNEKQEFEKKCKRVGISVVWYKREDRHHTILSEVLEAQCRLRELKVEPNYGSGLGEAFPK